MDRFHDPGDASGDIVGDEGDEHAAVIDLSNALAPDYISVAHIVSDQIAAVGEAYGLLLEGEIGYEGERRRMMVVLSSEAMVEVVIRLITCASSVQDETFLEALADHGERT